MAQTLVNIRMDEELKKKMEHLHRGVETLNAGKGVEHETGTPEGRFERVFESMD